MCIRDSLTLFIKDGSSFDLDGAKDGSITDPAAIFSTTTTEPQHGSSSLSLIHI